MSVFEITIRCLGGLLTAYDFTKDELMLIKAEELAKRLLPAFDSPTGIPHAHIDLARHALKPIPLVTLSVEGQSLQVGQADQVSFQKWALFSSNSATSLMPLEILSTPKR